MKFLSVVVVVMVVVMLVVVIVVVVAVVATFPIDCTAFESVRKYFYPFLENYRNAMELTGNTNMVSRNLKSDNRLFKN